MNTLRRQDRAGAGLKRIACEELESAIRLLTREQGRAPQARGALCRVRALLTLLEPVMPRAAVRRDQAILDRLMSGLAELIGPAELLVRLDAVYKKPPADADLASAVKALRKQWSPRGAAGQKMNSRAGSFNPTIYRLVADMAELRGHVGDWAITDLNDQAPPPGLRRTYLKTRRLMTNAGSDASISELADMTRLLAEQLGALSKCCPAMLKPQRKMLNRATEQLSEIDMDRQVAAALRKQLGQAKPAAWSAGKPAERVAEVLHQELGPALAETPAAFSNRIGVYWRVWRSTSSR